VNIQARLKLGAFIPVFLACLILIGWLFTLRTLNEAAEQEAGVSEIVKAVFELNVLAYEYAKNPAERPRVQWNWRSKSLQDMLANLAPGEHDPKAASVAWRLRETSSYASGLFQTLAERAVEGRKETPAKSSSAEIGTQDVVSQLLANSQQMVQAATLLADRASERRITVTRRASTMMIVYVLLLAAAMVVLGLQLSRYFAESVSRLQAGLEQIAAGHLDSRVDVKGHNEFAIISRSFNAMASTLHASKIELEEELRKRTAAQAQLRRLNETLEERVAVRSAIAEQRAVQLRLLASELTLAEQRERRRIAQLLHDNLGQLLVAAKMKTTALGSRVSPRLKDQTQQLEELLVQAINSTRTLMVDLSPPILYGLGLEPAVSEHIDQLQRNHQIRVNLEADDEEDHYPEDIRVLLFQAIRELLFNVVKHADVDEARVEIRRSEDLLTVTVKDSGVGFDPSVMVQGPRDHFGLFSIRERLEFVGGLLLIESSPGHGTSVRMSVPLVSTAVFGSDLVDLPAQETDQSLVCGKIGDDDVGSRGD
jgi:signal transduction histidine kinase